LKRYPLETHTFILGLGNFNPSQKRSLIMNVSFNLHGYSGI